MALTPPFVRQFLVHNNNTDVQADNAIDHPMRVEVPQVIAVGDESVSKFCSHPALVEHVRALTASVQGLQVYARGLRELRAKDNRNILNANWDSIEAEVGLERLSNSKQNLWQNGTFLIWDSATVPNGYTITGSPTISQQTVRTGGDSNRKACRITSGGAAGSISRTFYCRASAKYKVAGWIKMAANASATVTLTTNGATPVAVSYTFTNAIFGTDWLSFPREQLDVIDIETPSDATTITVKLGVDANHAADFSDFQMIRGVRCDSDLVESAPEDVQSAPGLGAKGTWTPTLTNTTNIASSTAYTCMYSQNGTGAGSIVTFSGRFACQLTAMNTYSVIKLSLPPLATSNFGAEEDCNGAGAMATGSGIPCRVMADAANDLIKIAWTWSDVNPLEFSFSGQYIVI